MRTSRLSVFLTRLPEAMIPLDCDEHLGVRVPCANGPDFTAGLDVPKFFDPNATVKLRKQGNIDPSASPIAIPSHP